MPTKEWLELYEQKRALTRCPNDLNCYFTLDMLAGRRLDRLSLGPVSLPTGRALVRDPMVYLDDEEEPYFQVIPAGEYEAVACVVVPAKGDCARYAAVRVRFSEDEAVRFEEALLGNEDLSGFGEGEYFGFNVESGLACICDVETRDAFCAFAEGWYESHPDGNLYDDYFARLFAKSYEKAPKYQRPEGDWLNWKAPNTGLHMPLFQSGFGDGTYPVYFGYDESGKVCQLVIQFVDIEMAFGEKH